MRDDPESTEDSNGGSIDGRTARWANRRTELLTAATEYVLDNGITDLSLRPLAKEIGVSITTLIRQFQSKEVLVQEICRNAYDELITTLADDPAFADQSPDAMLAAFWRRSLDPRYQRDFRLLFELYGLATHEPEQYRWFTDSIVRDWMTPIESALLAMGEEPAHARHVATLVLATIRGLHLDLTGSQDLERVDRAFKVFTDAVFGRAPVLPGALAHPAQSQIVRARSR